MSEPTNLTEFFSAMDRHLDERLEAARTQASEILEDLEAMRQVRVSVQRKAEELERIHNTAASNALKVATEYERLAALRERAANAMAQKPPESPQAPKRAIRAIKDIPRLREELANASSPINVSEPICGVYFLMVDTEVVYVGQSVNILSRIATHASEGQKDFNRWCYLNAQRRQLDELEMFYIVLLRPRYNVRGKPTLAATSEPVFSEGRLAA
jgi:hypothetical protein